MNLLDLFVKVSVKDEASGQMESLSTSMIAKGQTIANAITSAIGAAVDAIKSIWDNVIMGALEAYGRYEQLVGGMQTFFGEAADTVIGNAKEAYNTAGMSANQYMSNVSGFAMSLITSVSKQRQGALKSDTAAQRKALQTQLSDLQKSLSAQLSERRKELSSEVTALREALAEQVEAQREANEEAVEARSKQLSEQYDKLRESLENENKAFKDATSERIKEINREYAERLRLTDAEEYKRIKAIEDQIDALNGQTDAERDAMKKRQQLEKIANLQYQMANGERIEDREKAERELNDYLEQIEQEKREAERKSQIERLKEQEQAIRDEYDARREKIKTQQSLEIEQYQAQRDREYELQQKANQRKLKEEQESNQRILKELQKSMAQQLKSMEKANDAQVRSEEDRADKILNGMREANDQQMDAMREYVTEHSRMLEEAAQTNSGYVEATAEDQKKAAELADIAIRDMADNANKTGTAIEMIQNAYQGFSKDNFTMLDNLGLGYSGTREEMERLLGDAEQVQAKYGEMRDYSIDSFADIVEAIHVMQVEMGISGLTVDELRAKLENNDFTVQEISKLSKAWYGTGDAVDDVRKRLEDGSVTVEDAMVLLGTTAKEGATTYEGAIDRVKAAWENWLSSLNDPDEDVEASTKELMESVGNAAGLIVPRLKTILKELIKLVQEYGPEIAEEFKKAFLDAVPPEAQEDLEKYKSALDGIASAIEGITNAIKFVSLPLQALGEGLGYLAADIATTFDDTALNMAELEAVNKNTADNMIKEWEGYPEEIRQKFINADGTLTEAGQNIIDGLMGGANSEWEQKKPWWESIGDWIVSHKGPEEYDKRLLRDAGRNIISGLMNGATETWDGKKTFFSGIGDTILSYFSGSPSWLTGSGSDVMGGLFDGINGTAPDVLRFFWGLPDAFVGSLGDTGNLLVGSGMSLLDGLWSGATHVGNMVVDWFMMLPNAIYNAMGNLGNLLWGAGQDIMNGFWNGLEDTFRGVQDWVLGVGEWIQNNKGPRQYDLRLLVSNGQWIMSGLKDGLEHTFNGEVMPLVSDMAGMMEDAFGTPQLSAEYSNIVSSNRAVAASNSRQPTTVNAILELDRVQLGRVVFQLNDEETQRVGVSLTTGIGAA